MELSTEDEVRRNADLQFIKDWIDIASEVGAERVRIIAGDAAPKMRPLSYGLHTF